MVNELMEHFKEQSVVNFISLLGESQYTARCLLSRSKYFRMLKRLVFFQTQQGMFSAAPNELSRFKLDVHRNMARYVLSNSKRFGLLPKTLPHSVGFSLRSQEN